MNGLGLHTGRLREPLCCSAGRRGKKDPGTGFPESSDDTQGSCGLSSTGAAGKDEHFAPCRLQDRLHLDLVILHTGPAADPLSKAIGVHADPVFVAVDRVQPLGCARLGKKEWREVDGFCRGFGCGVIRFFRILFFYGDRFRDDVLRPDHLVERHREDVLLYIQKFCPGFQEHVPCRIAVPVFRQPVQSIQDAAPQAGVLLPPEAHLFGDRVCRFKTDAPDILRQAVGVLLHHLNALVPVGLEDLRGVARRNVVLLQKEHDILDLLLLLPALLNPIHAHAPDPGHLKEAVRVFLDDIQRVGAKLLYDPARKTGADPLHETAPEVFLNSVHGCGQRLLEGLHGELAAVFGVDPPGATEVEYAPHMHVRHGTHNSHEVLVALCAAFDDGISVVRILVGDAFYDAAEVFHQYFPLHWFFCGFERQEGGGLLRPDAALVDPHGVEPVIIGC